MVQHHDHTLIKNDYPLKMTDTLKISVMESFCCVVAFIMAVLI